MSVTFLGRVDVSGVSARATGPPVVELLVEPSPEAQRTAEAAGEAVSVLKVAAAPASPDFSLSLDLASLDPRFVGEQGYVNVMLAARYGGRVSTWGVTVWPRDTVKQVPTFDMSKASAPPGGDSAQASVEPAAAPCGRIVWGDYNGPYEVKIMNVMNTPRIDSTWIYFPGGSTATTLGYLTNGPNWSVGGTITISFSGGSGFITHPTNRRVQALWMYRERAVICYANQNVPYNYYGRGSTPRITHVHFPYCGSIYFPGETYIHSRSDNQTFSAGLTVYGTNLSSQAGSTDTASLSFDFGVRGKVCGNEPYRGEDSPRVDARPA